VHSRAPTFRADRDGSAHRCDDGDDPIDGGRDRKQV
jgi:hypothetical protein